MVFLFFPKPLQDCETGIKDFFNNKLYIIGYVGIGIAGVMVSWKPPKMNGKHTLSATEVLFIRWY